MGEYFSVWNDELCVASGLITGNGTFDLLISNSFANNGGYNSIRCVIEYNDLDPSNTGGFGLTTFIESSDGLGNWFPVAYQFEPIHKVTQGIVQVIATQPNMVNFDEGVTYSVWDGLGVVAGISRQQGRLGDDWRLRAIISELCYGDPIKAFKSVKLTAYGERFNA